MNDYYLLDLTYPHPLPFLSPTAKNFWLYRTRYAKLPSQTLKPKPDENLRRAQANLAWNNAQVTV